MDIQQIKQRILDLHYTVDCEPSETACNECSVGTDGYYSYIVEWPCATLEAIGVSE